MPPPSATSCPAATAVRSALAYPSVADLPQIPDLAVLAPPADSIQSLVAELGARGCRAAVVISAGFEGPNGVKLPLASAPASSDGRPAVYGVRPEHFTIADDGAEAEIVVVEPTGSETQVFAKLGGEQVVAVFRERHQFSPGDKVRLKPNPSLVHLFDETTGKRLNA